MAGGEAGVTLGRPHLSRQDLTTLDVTKLTLLSHEVISRQATINMGTMGHVAHRKSTVVKVISGVHTVRFKNELERNITIKLGYANAKIYKLDGPSCPRPECYRSCGSSTPDEFPTDIAGTKGNFKSVRHISFVDCPGHDILMATMLNGAAAMDVALLLIASNESCPQPQTSEHLAAIEIMKLKHILILQNKIGRARQKAEEKRPQGGARDRADPGDLTLGRLEWRIHTAQLFAAGPRRPAGDPALEKRQRCGLASWRGARTTRVRPAAPASLPRKPGAPAWTSGVPGGDDVLRTLIKAAGFEWKEPRGQHRSGFVELTAIEPNLSQNPEIAAFPPPHPPALVITKVEKSMREAPVPVSGQSAHHPQSPRSWGEGSAIEPVPREEQRYVPYVAPAGLASLRAMALPCLSLLPCPWPPYVILDPELRVGSGICTLVFGFWGPRAATGFVRPSAHVRRGGACERGHREWDGGSLKLAVLFCCLASRRGVSPRPGRQAWPRRHQLRERKDGRFPALPQGAQNGGRGTRESGRVSHPHKGKGPFRPRPPLHVTPRSTGRRPGTSISSPSFWSTSSLGLGEGFCVVEFPHT
ncbi:PREDICTED: uncharacterized protein LOC105512495 [Colobus angolensis palliatus]|uniref:uncharacterized protein LOC105512495 n=1 Tax=Colobus angolensis palliatus TaxID=336983 RepID=UPI0005F53E68|nr:PREDICTED: uncharacterized protein LOC105512495 [Colobus angolensis palliatus]